LYYNLQVDAPGMTPIFAEQALDFKLVDAKGHIIVPASAMSVLLARLSKLFAKPCYVSDTHPILLQEVSFVGIHIIAGVIGTLSRATYP
jgi:hypothetical protein